MKKLLFLLLLSALSSQLSAQTMDLSSWMSRLPDSRMVCKVSIPGTHDTMTGEGFADKGSIDGYTTQVAGLAEQLNGGMRYFDMRLIFNTDAKADTLLQTCHRTALISKTYAQALNTISTFLGKHPSEFVIIKIQYDGGTLSPQEQQTWNRLIHESITSLTPNPSTLNFKKDLTVGECRGKVLLLSRTGYSKPVSGAMTNWDDEGTEVYRKANLQKECSHRLQGDKGFARFYVQDFYNTIGSRMAAKLDAIEQMFQVSQQIADDDPVWVLSHTSGFSTPEMNALGYAENASKANKKLLELLEDKKYKRPVGIIAMDYACIDYLSKKIGTLGLIKRKVMSQTLTRKIIQRNFEVIENSRRYKKT